MMKRFAAALAAVFLVSAFAVSVGAEGETLLPVSPEDKLLAEWNFDENTTNDTKGTHHATLYNGSEPAPGTYVEGMSGNALQLSSETTDNYWLSIPYTVFGDSKDSFSISIWYKSTGLSERGENSNLFTLYNSTAEKFLFYSPAIDANSKNGFTFKWDGTYGYANMINSYTAQEWTHLVYCVAADGSKTVISAYVNGEKAEEVDQGEKWENSLMSLMGIDRFTIGGYNPYKGGNVGAGAHSSIFYGQVDEIQLYAGTISDAEALYLYDSVMNPAGSNPDTGVVAAGWPALIPVLTASVLVFVKRRR